MIMTISNANPLDSQIEYYLGLLAQETSKDQASKEAGKKLKELGNALIEYCIANQKGDENGKQAAMAEIEQILKSFGEEVMLFKKVELLIKQVQADPADWNANLLNTLKEISGELQTVENSP